MVGREDLHLHDLRHGLAASLLGSGVSIAVTASILGHRDQTMILRRYGHLETGHLAKVMDARFAHGAMAGGEMELASVDESVTMTVLSTEQKKLEETKLLAPIPGVLAASDIARKVERQEAMVEFSRKIMEGAACGEVVSKCPLGDGPCLYQW